MKNKIIFSDLLEIKQELRKLYGERLNLMFKFKEFERDSREGKYAQTLARIYENRSYYYENISFVNKQIAKLENTLKNSNLI